MRWKKESQVDGVSSFMIEWASRLQGPQSTSATVSESTEWRRADKAMLRVKGALDACRVQPVSGGWLRGHRRAGAWRWAEVRQQSPGVSVSTQRRAFVS